MTWCLGATTAAGTWCTRGAAWTSWATVAGVSTTDLTTGAWATATAGAAAWTSGAEWKKLLMKGALTAKGVAIGAV